MRKSIIAILFVFSGSGHAAEKAQQIVNLDSPGMLEAVEKENPEHYRKIVEIIRISQAETCETLPKILKTRLDVVDFECRSYLLLSSQPPKRHLSFTLDNIGYVTNAVQYKLANGKLVPAN